MTGIIRDFISTWQYTICELVYS